jgi:hypothetical protein
VKGQGEIGDLNDQVAGSVNAISFSVHVGAHSAPTHAGFANYTTLAKFVKHE